MPVVKAKPTSPGRRFVVKVVNPDLYRGEPYKPLLEKKSKTGGRNNNGRITTRHIGGGHKQKYRVIDFKRNKFGVPARVASIEYDPNRSARIALLVYADGEKRYIVAPNEIKVGNTIQNGPDAPPEPGNCLPLSKIPVGSFVHAIEMKPGKGAQLARSAGTFAQLTAREGKHAILRLPSGETRMVMVSCMATIGTTSNPDHMNIVLGKAGRNRWLGVRPKTRAPPVVGCAIRSSRPVRTWLRHRHHYRRPLCCLRRRWRCRWSKRVDRQATRTVR